MTIYKTMSAMSDIFDLTASPNDVSVMIDMDVMISMSLRSSSHSQYSGDRGCPSSLMNLQVFIRQSIFNSLHTLSVQIHTRDASVTTVHLSIALNARCIVSSHLFSLSGSLRLLLFVLMCQLVVIIRIFRLDFITVGEDDITYAQSNFMMMILNVKFEILQEHYVVDDVLYLSNVYCRYLTTNHYLSLHFGYLMTQSHGRTFFF